MFENLKPQPKDMILSAMMAYRADTRPQKVDLSVGVYKDVSGNTPIIQAVKKAEAEVMAQQNSKSYVALNGNAGFNQVMRQLVLGDVVPDTRLASTLTPGGSGAVFLSFEILKALNPDAVVHVPEPSWGPHHTMARHLGLKTTSYRYLDSQTGSVDSEGMMEALAQAKSGDMVILHGCCHNPSGADLTFDDWQHLATLIQKKGLLPLVDIAYQGFANGLHEDAAGLRHLAVHVPEMLITASCSKNFGLYRERTGILIGLTSTANQANTLSDMMAFLNRQHFSFPPEHGAEIVTHVLNRPELRTQWQVELDEMRLRLTGLRTAFADALRQATNSDRFDFIARQFGMFSLLGLSTEQMQALMEEDAIYAVSSSRINIAGLSDATIPQVAEAIARRL